MHTYTIPIIMLLIIILATHRRNNSMVAAKIIKKKSKKENGKMTELAKRFIDKDCILYTFNGTQIVGIIKEVTDSAILIENKESMEAINAEFVVRIREYPRDKKGKKKSVVLD
ncbi:MAG: hypothetical protein E7617_00895 [Ruminococcaceae bacterium]|nr:hypothetical protein [Oscillospiraceae bacterium]